MGPPLIAGAAADVCQAATIDAVAHFPAVCELKLVIRSTPRRLTRMKWLLDALAGEMNQTSRFLDDVEHELGEMSVYLYGTDPVRLVQVTRGVLGEFHLLTGTRGVLTIAGQKPARSLVRFSTRRHRDRANRGGPVVTERKRMERFVLSNSATHPDVQRL